jgi:hypothetical protein
LEERGFGFLEAVLVPKILRARPAADAAEEKTVRKLAAARHAPADWILRGRMVALSWAGLRVPAIAKELGCHEQTVRRWLVRFNASGLDGLADLGGQGANAGSARPSAPGSSRW